MAAGAVNGRAANEDVCRRPLINGFGQMAIFNGLGKCLVDACWLAAGKQPKLKVICPKTIKYLHLPKPLINGRRQTSSFAALSLTAPATQIQLILIRQMH